MTSFGTIQKLVTLICEVYVIGTCMAKKLSILVVYELLMTSLVALSFL